MLYLIDCIPLFFVGIKYFIEDGIMPPIIPVRLYAELYAELEDILVVHIKIVLCMYHVTTITVQAIVMVSHQEYCFGAV